MPPPRLVLPSTLLLLVLLLLVEVQASSSSGNNSIKEFFSTRTATRIKSTAALFPFKTAPAAAATTPPSPIHILTDASYQETITSSNSSANVTWLVHAYAPFSPEATQLNKLLESIVVSSPFSAVRLGKVDLTQERHLSQDLLGLQEDDFQSHLFVLRSAFRAGGEQRAVPYHGARTCEALRKLGLGHHHSSSPTVPAPTHLNTPKEVLSFVKEHPLTFLLGRSIEESSHENMAEELGFILTCQANGWHHCGIVPSAEILVQVAPAAFRGYRPGEVDVKSNAIMKFEGHGQQSRLFPRGAPSSVSVREWMVQEGFLPLSQIDLEASHFRSFLFEQNKKQMLLAVIDPLHDSKEAINNLMQILQKSAAHKKLENVVFAYVTEGEAWKNFSQAKASASSSFFLLDPATKGLYQAPAEASQLLAFLQQQDEHVGEGAAPLLVLSPPAPPKQEQQAEGSDTYSDSDNDNINKKGFENLVLDALSSSILAVLVVLFLFLSPGKWWVHEAVTATTPKTSPSTPLSSGSGSNLPAQNVTEKHKQQHAILLPESES